MGASQHYHKDAFTPDKLRRKPSLGTSGGTSSGGASGGGVAGAVVSCLCQRMSSDMRGSTSESAAAATAAMSGLKQEPSCQDASLSKERRVTPRPTPLAATPRLTARGFRSRMISSSLQSLIHGEQAASSEAGAHDFRQGSAAKPEIAEVAQQLAAVTSLFQQQTATMGQQLAVLHQHLDALGDKPHSQYSSLLEA